MGPNNSFKPNALRYANHMAGTACHVVGSATHVGLTLALGSRGEFPVAEDYALAFFDILGFEAKFESIGLEAMEEKYRSLIRVVNESNRHMENLFGPLNFQESVYWTDEGDVVPAVKVFGAYASDSILVWSNAAWPDARGKSLNERDSLAADPALGWAYQTVPCDTFLGVCNEIICAGLEIGLPIRGSLAMGAAILDSAEKIFIGSPLIEAARLEKGQKFIGASCCPSFMSQIVPKRFLLPFSLHLKDGYSDRFGGAVLDWPRHWSKTRRSNIRDVVLSLKNDAGKASEYYDVTLAMIEASESQRHNFESVADVSIRSVYPAYSSPNLQASARAVRKA